MSVLGLFLKHPKDFNMSYREHMIFALDLCFGTFLASFFLFIHAFLPFIFINNGSKLIFEKYEKIRQKSEKNDTNQLPK